MIANALKKHDSSLNLVIQRFIGLLRIGTKDIKNEDKS